MKETILFTLYIGCVNTKYPIELDYGVDTYDTILDNAALSVGLPRERMTMIIDGVECEQGYILPLDGPRPTVIYVNMRS